MTVLPGRSAEAQAGACFAPPPAPAPAEVAVGTSPRSVAVGDFNGDGTLDLAVANANSNSVSIRLGVGNGAFTSPTPAEIPVGTSPVSVAVADLNGDGRLDLATANFNSSTVSIRLGDGNGTFTPASTPEVPVGNGPYSVAVGDFNGDGKPDLAVANFNSSTVSIRLGVGNGTFTSPSPAELSAGSRPTSLAVGDFNGDGALDLAVAIQGSNSVSIRLNVCDPNTPPVAAVPGPQTVAEDGTLVFSAAGGTAVTVADPDIGPFPARVTLTASHGSLTLAGTGGLTFTVGDGTDDPTVTFTGPLASVNAALNGLRYVPTPQFNGTDQLTITVSDQGKSGVDGPKVAGAAVPIAVTSVNDPPTAADDTYRVAARATLTVPAPCVLANDTDIDTSAASLTAVLVAAPQHGTLTLNPNGGFAYTPNATFAGTDFFTYRASDGIAPSNVATATITVSNAAPSAAADAYTVQTGTTLTVPAPGVLANDADPESAALTAVLVAGPQRGTLALAPDGGFTYTPFPGLAGSDSFVYRVSDGIASSGPTTATITVAPTACSPRPRVAASPTVGAGTLQVHVEATPLNTPANNPLRELRFGTLDNARVTLNGQPIAAGQVLAVPPSTIALDFTVERVTPGQATTVHFTVVDTCGEFPTFVGGGTAAGF